MDFSYRKLIFLKPQKEKGIFTFILALLTAMLLFIPYMIMDGGYFVFCGDYNALQIPFYKLAHEAVKSGNIGWNWYTDLGADFIGSYSSYLLGSPFFWITLLFSNGAVPYLLAPLQILKFACASLTAYLYIRRFVKEPMWASLGGLMYAFSGFSVYSIFFNFSLEAIVFFPLLLLSLELLITQNRRGVFALSVAICALVNYRLFLGMALFCVIYFLVRLFSKAIRVSFNRLLVLIFEAAIGILMAAILLLPSIFTIPQNAQVSELIFGWKAITYQDGQTYLKILQSLFFPPDIPTNPLFFQKAEANISAVSSWLPVFSMIGVLGFVAARKGNWLKRIICICLAVSLFPVLNGVLCAFNNAYYVGWLYMPILMMSLATVMLFEEGSNYVKTGFKWTAAATLIFALVIGLYPRKNSNGETVFGLYTNSEKSVFTARFWTAVAIAVISLVIAYLLLKLLRKNRNAFLNAAVVCVCVVSVIYGNVYVLTGRQNSYPKKDAVIHRLIEGKLDLGDESQYRIDIYGDMDNMAMYLGYPSINSSHPSAQESVAEFYQSIGAQKYVTDSPDTDMPALRNLLSVKYLINSATDKSFIDENGETLMAGYKYIDTKNGHYIYENQNYIPYGFSYDYYIDEETLDSYDDSTKTRILLKALLLNDQQITAYDGILTDISELWKEEAAESKPEDTVTDESLSGDLDVPENEAVENTVTEQIPEEEPMSLSTNDEAMAKDSERLRETSAYEFDVDNKGFTAKVKREKTNLVFFSVPFDEGWSATVNGKAARIEKVMNGFMAVKVDAGDSTVRFDYETPYLDLGIEITLGALLIFLIYFIACGIYFKKMPQENNYPEGDELLLRWHRAELLEAAVESMAVEDLAEPPEKPYILDDIPVKEDVAEPLNKGFEGGFSIDLSAFEDSGDK